MVPRTRDARVMFAIPWHDHAVVGTTDTPIPEAVAGTACRSAEEIDFILETASDYLSREPSRADILSVFAGIRPLVPKAGDAGNTAALSRDHTIQISKSGLLTIAGGKWTTYRRMAEDCVDHAITLAGLDERPCVTRDLRDSRVSVATLRSSGHSPTTASTRRRSTELIDGRPELGARIHGRYPMRGRAGRLGRAPRDGAHRGRRAGAADAGAVAQREGGHRHGPGRGADSWPPS